MRKIFLLAGISAILMGAAELKPNLKSILSVEEFSLLKEARQLKIAVVKGADEALKEQVVLRGRDPSMRRARMQAFLQLSKPKRIELLRNAVRVLGEIARTPDLQKRIEIAKNAKQILRALPPRVQRKFQDAT